MDPDLNDLLPLFVAEARGRLERLAELAPLFDQDPAAAGEVRRELHTLKGAGRMMGLTELAQVCHLAESHTGSESAGVSGLLTRVVDTLNALVEALERGTPAAPPAELLEELSARSRICPAEKAETPVRDPIPSFPAATASPGRQEVRIADAVLDTLAESATRLRIHGHAAAGFPLRFNALAEQADGGAPHADPLENLRSLASSARSLARELDSVLRRLRNETDAHLDRLLGLQLQPLRGLFQRLARHTRELAARLGKEVEVILDGEDTTLDRRIARDLEEVLLHLARNAVDHGIEPPDRRLDAGKPRAGTVKLTAIASGRSVELSVEDDGAGIDVGTVAERAVADGLLTREGAANATREDLLHLLFASGFSMSRGVTDVSGRGIGLDIVAAVAARNSGEVAIQTTPRRGTTVSLRVPVSRRGERVLRLRIGRLRLGLPAVAVRRALRVDPGEVVERDDRIFVRVEERLVPFVPLDRILGEEPTAALLLEGETAGHPMAVLVDAVEGEEEVLLRTPRAGGRLHPLIEGVAMTADGRPLAVLSPLALSHHAMPAADATARATTLRPPRVLLVDDSLVTREMVRRLLEEGGIEVIPAVDAADALDRLGRQEIDCLVTDVEMPGMDGMALTRHVRANPHTSHIPVVMLTTRDRSEDRLRGLEAGADAYVTKQGLNASELLILVRRLGGS